MNKYKKLILSLTISLLSFAGVEAMAKPIPQIKTYRELGTFVNQYPTNDFLTNKDVGFVDRGQEQGLLEVLLNAYNSLPSGAKPLAENLFQSKFRLNSKQLSDKLASISAKKAIPVTIAQAQAIIRRINREKTDLKGRFNTLETRIAALEAGIGGYAGNPADLAKLQAQYDGVLAYSDILRESLSNLNDEKDDLQIEYDDLQAKSAPKADLEKVKNDLDFANALIAQYQKTEAGLNAKIQELHDRINDILAHLSPAEKEKEEARLLLLDYAALAAEMNKFITDDVQKVIVPAIATIQGMDEAAATKLINTLRPNRANLQQSAATFDQRWADLDSKWNQLTDKTKRAEENDKIDALYAKIDQKINEIQAAILGAEDRLEEIEKAKGAKAAKVVADLIAEYKAFEQQYQKFDADNAKVVIFTKPDVTLTAFFADAKIIDPVQDIDELNKAIGIVTQYKEKAVEFQKNITAQLAQLNARPLPATITANEQAALDAVKKATEQSIANSANFLQNGIPFYIEEINKRIEALRPKPKTPEEQLVEEIDTLIKNLPTEQSIDNALYIEENVSFTGDSSDLEKALNGAEANANLYKPYLAEINKLEAKAKALPATPEVLDKLNTNEQVKLIKQVVEKTTTNIEALKQAIAKAKGKPAAEEVTDVAVDMDNYSLSFKIGNVVFKAEADNDTYNTQFAEHLKEKNITENLLETAGKQIVKTLTEQSQALGISGSIMNDVYKAASNEEEKKKIRAFMRPIFAFYKFAKDGNDTDKTYEADLALYGLNNGEITKELIGK